MSYRKKEDVKKYLDRLEIHQEIMDYNLDFLKFRDCFKDYPYLKKVFAKGNLKKKLKEFTEESKEKLLNPSTDKQGRPTFFVSARHLSRTYKSTPGSWNIAINIFFFLGLIEKLVYKNLKHSRPKDRTRKLRGDMERELKKRIRPVTHYHLYQLDQETLIKANEQAKRLIENNFTITTFDKEWIKKTFGEAEANRIYPYEHEPEKLIEDAEIKETFEYCLKEIIQDKGYIKPSDLKELVKQEELSFTDEPRKRKAIIKRVNRVYKSSLEELLKENGYEITWSNHELNKKYNLSGYYKIIIKRD